MWQLRGRYPNRGYPKIFNDATVGSEAKKLFEEAQAMLADFVKNKRVRLNGIVGFYPANSVGDDIEVCAVAVSLRCVCMCMCSERGFQVAMAVCGLGIARVGVRLLLAGACDRSMPAALRTHMPGLQSMDLTLQLLRVCTATHLVE